MYMFTYTLCICKHIQNVYESIYLKSNDMEARTAEAIIENIQNIHPSYFCAIH